MSTRKDSPRVYEKSTVKIVVKCPESDRRRWAAKFGKWGMAAMARQRVNALLSAGTPPSRHLETEAGRAAVSVWVTPTEATAWRLAFGRGIGAVVRMVLEAG